MRAIAVVLCLLPGCVYHVDGPRDGGMPDVSGCCDLVSGPGECCLNDPTNVYSGWGCRRIDTLMNCGGCGVVCGDFETCFDPGWADGVRLTPYCRDAR